MSNKKYTVATILSNNTHLIYPLMDKPKPDLSKVTDVVEKILNDNKDKIRDLHGAQECVRMLRLAEKKGPSAYAGTFVTWQTGSKIIK